MNLSAQFIGRFVLGALAALALLIGPAALFGGGTIPQSQAACYNGVVPLNPYVPSCTLPSGPQVRGAAPNANAIIACHHHPGCLAWYVNGGP